MQEKSGIKKLITAMLIAGCCLLTVAFPHVFGRRGYYLAAFIYAVMAIGSVLLSFENRNTAPLKLAVLAVMCALGIGSRMVFAGVPFIKPVAAIVILTGACMGPQRGFVSGAVIMLVSNFMFGQGPWTVWQMLAFGITGMLAGVIFYKNKTMKKPVFLSVFGFVCYRFITGPILDLSGIFAYSMGGKTSLIATLTFGFGINLTSAVSTAVFLVILADPIIKKLNRINIKYGL
ncbi:MAG: ECF transporter S component [Oscillospiraceae bacterium]|nr:ECF transporter S component [Oscillospiraceae bacterium]